MEDIAAFLNMGGYAAFVWPSLGIATVVLVAMMIASIRRLRASEAALAAAEAAAPERRRRTKPGSGA